MVMGRSGNVSAAAAGAASASSAMRASLTGMGRWSITSRDPRASYGYCEAGRLARPLKAVHTRMRL
jgi:hypothetical protein